MKSRKVCIIGAEAWGSALATAVGNNALIGEFATRVHIYVYDELVRYNYLSEVMNDQHENIKYLPGIKLPENLIAVNDLLEAAQNADILIFATPQSFVKSYCNILERKVKSTAFAVSMIKGLDHIKDGEFGLVSQAITNQLKIPCYSMMCANSAMEMAQGKLCEITIGCNNGEHARVMTTVFQTDNCKVVVSNDVHGVELCGTLKDIIALGAGFIDGLWLGDNARVAALHLGLKEMMRFVKTFYPTTKTSTFFESCGLANSVASSYCDKNVTLAKNFVTSGKTVPEIEANLLSGRKLLGPLVAKEVYSFLQKKNMLEQFPLFVVIHKICQNEVPAIEIINILRNHPDLSTSSISDLMHKEHHMGLKNAAELIPNTVPVPLSLEPIETGSIESECFSEDQQKPFYQYFTAKEAKRKTEQLNTFTPSEEHKQLILETSSSQEEPFKMECRDNKRNVSLILEEIDIDATKPIVACGTTNSSTHSDFRIVKKSLSTDKKGGAPFDFSNTSKNSDFVAGKHSTPNDEDVDALDLSTKTKMDDWMIDNACQSDQLPPSIMCKKGGPSRFKTDENELLQQDMAQEMEEHSTPKVARLQTLNVNSQDKDQKRTNTFAVLDESVVNFIEGNIKHEPDAKTTEVPLTQDDKRFSFESIQDYRPTPEAISSLGEELLDLEPKQPQGNVPMAISDSQKSSDKPPIKEIEMINHKDAMFGTDLKELELEITNLSNTMHLKETEFLQQELAKLHQKNSPINLDVRLSDEKPVNLEVFMEELGQHNDVQAEYRLPDDSTQKNFKTADELTLKTAAEMDKMAEPNEESSQTVTQKYDEKSKKYDTKHLYEPEDFEQEESKEKNQFEEKPQINKEEIKEIQQTENLDDKLTQNKEYLTTSVYDKMNAPEAEPLNLSVRKVEPQMDSTQDKSHDEFELEERFFNQGKLLASELEVDHPVKKIQLEEKSTHNPEDFIDEDSSNKHVIAEIKEDDTFTEWLNNYTVEKTMDKKISQRLEENNLPSQNFEKREKKEWEWLHNNEKIEDDVIDERHSEFYVKNNVVDLEEEQLSVLTEELKQMSSAINNEAGRNKDPEPIHEMKKSIVVHPETPAAPAPKPTEPKEETPIHFTQPRSVPPPSPQTQPLSPQQKKPIRKDVPIFVTEEELADTYRDGKKYSNAEAESMNASEILLKNEMEHPDENKRERKHSMNETPKRTNAAEILSTTEGESKYSKSAVPADDRSSRYDTKYPNIITRESQSDTRGNRREKSSPKARTVRKAPTPVNHEVDSLDVSKSTLPANNTQSDVLRAKNKQPSNTVRKTNQTKNNSAAEQAKMEDNARRSELKETRISRVTKKLRGIMSRGQDRSAGLDVSNSQSKVSKQHTKSSLSTKKPPPFPKLIEEGRNNVSGLRRRLPEKPPITPPLNPRVRIPQPPFDARDREYHTMARSYRSPPDLTRLHPLPIAQSPSASAIVQDPISQIKQISTFNISVLPQVRGSPWLQIPRGLPRSLSLAKIVSVLQLGLLANFLTCYKLIDNSKKN